MKIYRTEHPNPQWERKNWKNLNGEWDFELDLSKSAREKKLYEGAELTKKIIVPFCPESDLSGIGYKDFIPAVCYKKVIEISEAEIQNNVFLHFGAVDFESFIYINGELAGRHEGGYSSFEIDITKYLKLGKNVIFVIAEDDTRSGSQPTGKQSTESNPSGCLYTRTTGIWQTVWLEFVPKTYIKNAKYYPDINSQTLTIIGEVIGSGEIKATAKYKGKTVGESTVNTVANNFMMQVKLSKLHLWEIGKGRLYDLELSFNDDSVKSYFGMRSVCLDGIRFMLNNKPVFLRTVLDQGYYPDGIYTAKSDDEFIKDIQISMDAGFNSARLHQKVFEKRFIYYCDKMGYMVWGEHANWGMDYKSAVACENFINEWMEILERDFNSPAIIGWCPFNETWEYFEAKEKNYVGMRNRHRIIETVYNVTKSIDSTRPCIETSGNYHIDNYEIFDVHDYESDPEKFKEHYAHIDEGIVNDQVRRMYGDSVQKYIGGPIYLSEYGGMRWSAEVESGWGYCAPESIEEFIKHYKDLTDVILDNPYILGFCYTQLYDVETEMNGLYTYNRVPKFDIERFKKINQRKAKIEE